MSALLACTSQWAGIGAGAITLVSVLAFVALLRVVDKIGDELRKFDRENRR